MLIARRGEDWEWSVDEAPSFTAGWAGSFADCWGGRFARGTAVEVSEDITARNASRTVFTCGRRKRVSSYKHTTRSTEKGEPPYRRLFHPYNIWGRVRLRSKPVSGSRCVERGLLHSLHGPRCGSLQHTQPHRPRSGLIYSSGNFFQNEH